MTRRLARLVACCIVLHATWPAILYAQPAPQSDATQTTAPGFNTEQLDALVAPIALYPDPLLTQILMASTYPLQVVEAARWAEQPANKALTGDALTKALEKQNWDPSVKSLVPFPEVLAMMNGNLDWMQQLGYAFADQQPAVLDSVQRLRHQAQSSGHLESTPQQVVKVEQQTIVIEPAQPNVVYVPSYNPTVVYGTWPYPSYPPVYLPPPPGYPVASALVSGLAFGAGVAITAGLWNWARPVWGPYGRGGYGGYVNVNVNRYNNINVNRAQINSNHWQANRPGGRPAGLARPPTGPVGAPARPAGLPAGAIGRSQVAVPRNAVRPPTAPQQRAGTARPGAGAPATRPAPAARPGGGQAARPGAGAPAHPATRPAPSTRPGAGQAARPQAPTARPTARPAPAPASRPSTAFSGMNQGRQANQYGNRGAQSRSAGQFQRPSGGGAPRGGGGRAGGGGRGGRR